MFAFDPYDKYSHIMDIYGDSGCSGMFLSMFVQLLKMILDQLRRAQNPPSSSSDQLDPHHIIRLRASVNQGVLVCIQCAGTSETIRGIMKPMRLEYQKAIRLKSSKPRGNRETNLSILTYFNIIEAVVLTI